MNYEYDADPRVLQAFGNSLPPTSLKQELDSRAVFATLTYYATEKLALIVGGRQSWDEKQIDIPDFGLSGVDEDWSEFMFDFTADYAIDDHRSVYVRFARGSRPGGFDSGDLSFESEQVDSFEIGLKSQWFDRRLTFNGAIFTYEYDDQQRNTTIASPDGTSFTRRITAITESEADGFELELQAVPVPNLFLNLTVGYLDVEYTSWLDFNAANEPIDKKALPVYYAPEWTFSGAVSYDIEVNSDIVGLVTPQVSVTYKDDYYTLADAIPSSFQEGFSLVNATVRFEHPSGRYALTVEVVPLFWTGR